MFTNKAKSEMRVDFNTGQMVGDTIAFKPGEAIRGSVSITPENDVSLSEIEVKLGWHTEGRGDRDGKVMERVSHTGGLLSAGSPRTLDFSFTAPPIPWSYAGTLINIIWAIEVTLVQERGRNFDLAKPIIISPTLNRLTVPAGAY